MWAVAVTPVPLLLQVVLLVTAFVLAGKQLLGLKKTASITHVADDDIWIFSHDTNKPTRGPLIAAGYRSNFLLVLVIQTEDHSCHHVAVWRDQVTAVEFSYLNFQLLYNTVNPYKKWPVFFSKSAG